MAQSFTSISADGRRSLAATTSGFNSEADDEEIDQLDSGLDDEGEEMEPEIDEEDNVSTLKGRRKLGVRVPGQTLLPQDKVDNILQAEGSGQHMSKEAVFMLSIATEEFIKKLAEAGYRQTLSESRQHVQYRDMATITQRRSEFRFLEDTIPKPISITEAMARRAQKEREMLEDDPAISAAPPSSPSLMPSTPTASASISATKAKPKARQSLASEANGKQKTNGSSSAAGASGSASISATSAAARQRYRDSNGRWRKASTVNGAHSEVTASSTGTRAGSARIRNRSARAREAAEAATPSIHTTHQNGTSPLANGRSASSASMYQDARGSPGSPAQANRWAPPGQFTGPASGYLEDGSRVLLNGRSSSMADNPGRTIYSQQRPSAQPR
ncbi:hypothetical protein BD414DRAFT_115645 [Trametes punicea]|nr:hypothetical protein BD414DRAFT_115645 [Trametes punicea]